MKETPRAFVLRIAVVGRAWRCICVGSWTVPLCAWPQADQAHARLVFDGEAALLPTIVYTPQIRL